MKYVHRKFDADRLSKKKVIEKIRWTTFVDFGYHLGLRIRVLLLPIILKISTFILIGEK